jgi:hypothetical protein
VSGFGKQTRLPETRLAAEHERLADRCDLVKERRQEPQFACAIEKRRDLVTSSAEHELILRSRASGARVSLRRALQALR